MADLAVQPDSDRQTLRSEICSPGKLSVADRKRAFHLMASHFFGIEPEQFYRDLDDKQWAVVLRDANQTIQGFSTLARMEVIVDDQPVSACFSGDTALAPEYWGNHQWLTPWFRHVQRMTESAVGRPYYWLLLTATHRTYRFLPAFFREYYPHSQHPTPPHVQARLDALVHSRFSRGQYDARQGIVRLHKATPYRSQADPSAAAGRDDRHVAFFRGRNPGYLNGEYLACITEIADANITRLGRRILQSR
jgi:hypothetical protein